MIKNKIKPLIFAVLWGIGLIMLIVGLSNKNEIPMVYGAAFLSLYGITKSIKFIFGKVFDLLLNKKKADHFYFEIILNAIILIIFGYTGLPLFVNPFLSIIEIIKDLKKNTCIEEEKEEKDDNYIIFELKKFTWVGIYGILLGIFNITFGLYSSTIIGNLVGDEYFLSTYIGQFLFMSSFLIGLIEIILSIRIGSKWGLFNIGGAKQDEKEININGKDYYIRPKK